MISFLFSTSVEGILKRLLTVIMPLEVLEFLCHENRNHRCRIDRSKNIWNFEKKGNWSIDSFLNIL